MSVNAPLGQALPFRLPPDVLTCLLPPQGKNDQKKKQAGPVRGAFTGSHSPARERSVAIEATRVNTAKRVTRTTSDLHLAV